MLRRGHARAADPALALRADSRPARAVRTIHRVGETDRHDRAPQIDEYLARLVVKSGERFLVLRAEEVDWVDSAANYVQLHVGRNTFLLRSTMKELDRRLSPSLFARVHRTAVVNLDQVREIVPSRLGGDFTILLRDGTQVPLSRAYRERLFARLMVGRAGKPTNKVER